MREATDQAVIDRLKEKAGHQYQIATLAAYFNETYALMHAQLQRLADAEQIRMTHNVGHKLFYWPSAEQLQPKPAPVFKTYVQPAGFARVQEQIADYRAIASKGGD